VVFEAGQHALLEDLEDDVLPGVREGVARVERDERWHIGFGLRCLIETYPSDELLDDLLARAEDAAEAWGDAIPVETRERAVRMCARRLSVVRHEAARQVAVERHWPAWRVDGVPGPT
jgi:ribonucleoside-diphosphate reductase beta chain